MKADEAFTELETLAGMPLSDSVRCTPNPGAETKPCGYDAPLVMEEAPTYCHHAKTCVHYLERVFTGRRKTIASLVTLMQPMASKFEYVAFRGMSGALIAPCVAEALGKEFTMVRKPCDTDHSHSTRSVEGYVGGDYVIVDDLASSGRTVLQIQAAIEKQTDKTRCRPGKCVAIFLYNERVRVHHPDNAPGLFLHKEGKII
jgi:hypothetical protein